MDKKQKYFNFPVQLLEGFMVDKIKCLNNLLHYAIYAHSLKLEYGTDIAKMKNSAEFYNVRLGDPNNALLNGKRLYDLFANNSPMVGIESGMFWQYHDNYKSDFEKACLLAFLAIKSIIGSKPFCKITKLYLWSRMDGKTHAVKDRSELSKEVREYTTRHKTDLLKNELVSNWHLVDYSHHTRGIYVSFKLDLDSLAYEAEKKKKSTMIEQQKKLKAEALAKARKRLS